MQTYTHAVAGDTVLIRIPQNDDDLRRFMAWARGAWQRGPVALDTETTGLDIFAPGYRLRTVQFGDANEAWVIHWERGGRFHEAALYALKNAHRFLIHNAPFDWLVLDRHAGIPLESLAPRTSDTQIRAKLVDPRQQKEGGIGSGLKPLSAALIDPEAADTQGDLTAVFRSLGFTKATGWAGIPLDHPTYNLYAGLDVIYAARLDPILTAVHSRLSIRPALVEYEHDVARICAVMQRAGMVLDVPYAENLRDTLSAEEEKQTARAARYGVTSVNSGPQVSEALIAMGETLKEKTDGGAWKVDKEVLMPLADLDRDWQRIGARDPNPLADAVQRAKRAGKWRSSYADTFLRTVDASGRIHPMINTLQARTGRMSVTGPALQTLPSTDYLIRGALLADEGHVIVSTDFTAIELRILAALADVTRMKQAINNGDDLHDFTARLVFGDGFTKRHRKIAKGIGFGKVYGGGLDTIARQTGAPRDEVRAALAAYDRAYPQIRRASSRWQREARATGLVTVSATGRRLPLDAHRMYAVVNYQCQSAARDVLGQAMLHMEAAGLLPYMKLPIHDEVLASVPKSEASDFAREFERCMTMTILGVPIAAEAEIGGRSWGSLYGLAA